MDDLPIPVTAARAPKAVGPYSQAVRYGGLLFVSGCLGLDPATGSLAEGLEAQAERALANLEAILRAAGTDAGRVLKTTVFLRDMGAFDAVNAVYAGHFRPPFPARSCVEVGRLPRNAEVEIEAVAALTEAAGSR